MANTTFNGSVRSENNFKVISKAASTGLVSDRTIGDGLKDSRRYYLEDILINFQLLTLIYKAQKQKTGAA